MPERDDAVLSFLATRRSHPPKLLSAPGPDRAELTDLLTMAARAPDHGKLEPWRFVVLTRGALDTIAPLLHQAVLDDGQDEAQAQKAASAMASPVVVAVLFCPKDSPKVPLWEQELSAGAVCLGLVNAALASGWGASWLTGFAALNREFGQAHLGLQPDERVAGLIHLGTRGATPPERPRPDIDAITTWL
ncbi:nitroreductase [Paracoccus sp. 1_MG-2023]|uniref:nitroreductase family protein n=1 Tax=unclassified Paracoccus (in: a-proteobacteria) TaxID=2688777 RepID=UPI001C0A2200|nr:MULTISPECIES: nitroreductase [unclassified Paracoccus (in: a-proteobacteria)]MBU2958167.1 nitroreductase [Paracoccus sp. C2R09]MDO6668294.1 nitroreductase [Paracoccus sp. 1_MG-2023]